MEGWCNTEEGRRGRGGAEEAVAQEEGDGVPSSPNFNSLILNTRELNVPCANKAFLVLAIWVTLWKEPHVNHFLATAILRLYHPNRPHIPSNLVTCPNKLPRPEKFVIVMT